MSDTLSCNWCDLNTWEREAAAKDRAILVVAEDMTPWITVYEVSWDRCRGVGKHTDADAITLASMPAFTMRCVC